MIDEQEITETIQEIEVNEYYEKFTITGEEKTDRYEYIEIDLIFKYPEDLVDWLILTCMIFQYEDHYIFTIRRFWPGMWKIYSDQIYKNKNIKRKQTILNRIRKLVSE